jgi:hypothetical protein
MTSFLSRNFVIELQEQNGHFSKEQIFSFQIIFEGTLSDQTNCHERIKASRKMF